MADEMSAGSRRVEDAFAHREGDRVPLWGIIQNRPVYEHVLGAELVGDPPDVALDDKIRLHARVYRELEIDMTRAHIWPPARGRAADQATEWAPRTVTAGEIGDYRPELPDDDARDEHVAINCRILAADAPHTVFAPTVRGVFCPTFERMGLEEFSYAWRDSPGEVERVMGAHADYARSMAQRYADRPEVRVVAVCDDVAFKSGAIFPPDWMREVWLPMLAHVVEPLVKRGVRIIFHSDGNIEQFIPDLIDIGVAAINPLEPLAGMDLAALKREYGTELTLIGGVDCAQLLTFATPAAIRDEVRRLLDVGAPGGGFVIGDSSCIMPNTPLENVLAFYETVRESGP